MEIGCAAVLAVVVVLAVVPAIPIQATIIGCAPTPPVESCPLALEPSQASVTYYYLNTGIVYVPTDGYPQAGHCYAWVSGDTSTSCGWYLRLPPQSQR